MAAIGCCLLFSHLPRMAGRSIGRMLEDALVARVLDKRRNHDDLHDLLERHDWRGCIVGSFRPAPAWYASMAVSSLMCHPEWTVPFTRAVGTRPLAVVRAMVGPERAGVVPLRRPYREPDSQILHPLPGLSLLASCYVRAFMTHRARGLTAQELDVHHDELFQPHRVINALRVREGVNELLAELDRPPLEEERRVRESGSTPGLDVFYQGERGREVLAMIDEVDGWITRRWPCETGPALWRVR